MKNLSAKEILQWDVSSWSSALRFWEENTDWSKVQNALELGGREGGLSLWLASKGIAAMCSDLKDTKRTAQLLHRRYSVSPLVEYRDIDAANIPFEKRFDLIVFKSIIGGIGHHGGIEVQKKVFREIHKALKPGGKLLFAENLAASALHKQMRKRFVKWGTAWRYVSLDELHDFLSIFSAYTIKTTGVSATFGRSEGQRKMLSVLDNSVLNRICSDRMKYIGYGIAEKAGAEVKNP